MEPASGDRRRWPVASPPGFAPSAASRRQVGRHGTGRDPTPAKEEGPLIAREIRARLRYVEIESDRLTLDRFPDFLVAGPQRTGTTWLHAVLGAHPEVFLSDPKEIFFFSRLKTPEHPRFESRRLDWYLSFFRATPARAMAMQARCLRRYGRPWKPKVRGEATASYAAMDRDLIEEVATLNPRVKVLLTFRHPVDRAWSHAKKDLARNLGRPMAEVTDDEWRAFFRDPYQLRCARYADILANWRSTLGEERVLVSTFDEVERTPESLLARVTRFLGVSDDPRYVDAKLLRAAVNPTAGAEVPERHRAFLEDLLADEIRDWESLRGAAAAASAAAACPAQSA